MDIEIKDEKRRTNPTWAKTKREKLIDYKALRFELAI